MAQKDISFLLHGISNHELSKNVSVRVIPPERKNNAGCSVEFLFQPPEERKNEVERQAVTISFNAFSALASSKTLKVVKDLMERQGDHPRFQYHPQTKYIQVTNMDNLHLVTLQTMPRRDTKDMLKERFRMTFDEWNAFRDAVPDLLADVNWTIMWLQKTSDSNYSNSSKNQIKKYHPSILDKDNELLFSGKQTYYLRESAVKIGEKVMARNPGRAAKLEIELRDAPCLGAKYLMECICFFGCFLRYSFYKQKFCARCNRTSDEKVHECDDPEFKNLYSNMASRDLTSDVACSMFNMVWGDVMKRGHFHTEKLYDWFFIKPQQESPEEFSNFLVRQIEDYQLLHESQLLKFLNGEIDDFFILIHSAYSKFCLGYDKCSEKKEQLSSAEEIPSQSQEVYVVPDDNDEEEEEEEEEKVYTPLKRMRSENVEEGEDYVSTPLTYLVTDQERRMA